MLSDYVGLNIRIQRINLSKKEMLRMGDRTEIIGEKYIFSIYMLGFLILVLSVALNQPLADTPPAFGNPPDEHARYLIPKYICEHGKLPIGWEEEVRIVDYGFSYGLYNVFPYIVQGCLMRIVSHFTSSELWLLYTARLVNVMFGLLMALVVYKLSKRVFKDRCFRWLFCFAVMYLPQNIFIHSYVNTDSCCIFSTAMMVYGLVLTYKDGISRRSSLWMCGGIILCALSYYNAYGYILSSIFLFLAYFLRSTNGHIEYDWRNMFKWGSFISSIVILGIGWWFIRSYIVLEGDILGLETREKMAIQYAIAAVNPLTAQTFQKMGYSLWDMVRENSVFSVAFNSFVAAYGSMSIYGPISLYRAYKLFFGASGIGLFYYLLNRKQRDKIIGKALFLHINMIFCIIMPFILMLYYSYTIDYQPQGRYLLPALVPLMYYTVKGIEKLAGISWKQYKLPKWLVSAGVIFCFFIIVAGALEMIYFRAMPIYLETGVVLERQ